MSVAKQSQRETPKEAARRLASAKIQEGFQPEALHEYQAPDRKPIYWRIRAKHPDGRKWIRPMRFNGQGFELGEPNFDGPKPLYRLPDLRKDGPIYIVEGEKPADALAKIGVIATTSGGAESAKKVDWSPIKGREVIIWPDNDIAGLKYAQDVIDKIRDIAESIKIVQVKDMPLKDDAFDYLTHGGQISDLTIVDIPATEPNLDETLGSTESKPTEGKPIAVKLLEFTDDVEFFHDADQRAYAMIAVNEHRETWPVRSRQFKRWLAMQYYENEGRPPNSQAMNDALTILEAKAQFQGKEIKVAIRIGGNEKEIFLDLCDDQWRVVHVTAEGWKVKKLSEPKFIRARGMLPLPVPQRGGSLDGLCELLNVHNTQDKTLIIGWVVGSLNSRGPYPVLCFQGEQGAAKSTVARILRYLIDPSSSPLRTIPRNERDLMIAARNGWIIALDNVSELRDWLSDGLCRLATGGGFATRELFSDAEEVLFDAQRPITLNGIEDIATRLDLADRSIFITLLPIPESRRQPEKDLWAKVEKARPRILGTLLDAVSGALRELPSTQLQSLPRMADFAIWVTAAERSLGWKPGAFMKAYAENRKNATEFGISVDIVAQQVIKLVDSHGRWEGSATELLVRLQNGLDERITREKVWPKAANVLSNKLRRIAPALRAMGINIQFSHSEKRIISLDFTCKSSSASSGPSKASKDAASGADDGIVHLDDRKGLSSAPKLNNGAGLDDADGPDDKKHVLSINEDDAVLEAGIV